MSHPLSRRSFVKSAAAMGLAMPAVMPPLVRAASPNGKVNHAAIGVGGMGWGDLNNFAKHDKVRIAAICDVDSERLDKAAGFQPGAAHYADWRELLAKEASKIDSVNVTVPDHMHAPIAMTALRSKKHVYCQKPMCHDVAEVRALTEAAKQAGVVTQLGTQHASGFGDRWAVMFLKQKMVGKIKRVVLCSNRPGAVENYRLEGPRPAQGEQAPATLNWDLWIGTAPMRPFASKIYHPTKWRAWQDFGTGWSGDIGCHIFDAPWKALGLTAPRTIVAEVQESWVNSPARRGDVWPQGDHITWTFPGNTYTDGDLKVEWFDGAYLPPQDVQTLSPLKTYPAESAMIIGTEGAMLLPHGVTGRPHLIPGDKFASVELPKLEVRNHYHHFIDTVLGAAKCESHFAQTGPMTEAILLGTVAIRTPGVVLEWDAKKMAITNAPQVQKLLRREYREGWGVPGLA